MGELAGKLALVTGAGAGVGRAVAIGLAQLGARVIATDFVEAQVEQLAASLRADGLVCEARQLDVGDLGAVEMLVDELELTQSIELLANVSSVLDVDDDVQRRAFRIQADGVFHVSRSVAQRMKQRANGAIAIVSSDVVRVPSVQRAAHAASKAAAHMFAKCLAEELADHGVRCGVIAPELPTESRRVVSTREIVQAVLLLLSDRAAQGSGSPFASVWHVVPTDTT